MPHLRAVAFVLALALCAGPDALAVRGVGYGPKGHLKEELQQQIKRARELVRAGDYPAAEKMVRKQLDFVRSRLGEDSRPYGAMLTQLGRILLLQGRYDEAEAVSRRGLELRERWFDRRDERVRGALLHVGEVLAAQNNYAEAEALMRRALDESGADVRLDVLLALGQLMKDLGRYAEAETFAAQAMKISDEAAAGTKGRGGTGPAYLLSAHIRAEQGRTAEALELAQRARQRVVRKYGGEHPAVARIAVLEGELLHRMGRSQEAVEHLEQARAVAEKILGRLHPLAGEANLQLALAFDALGRWEPADAAYRAALRSARASAIPTQVAQAARGYGRHLVQRDRLAEALPYYREAIEMVERVFAETRGQSEEIRQRFAGRLNATHHELIELLVRLHAREPGAGRDREALAVASLTQSRIFSELLRQADVNQFVRDDAFRRLQRERVAAVDRLRALRREAAASGFSERELAGEDDDEDDGDEAPAAADSGSQDARAENLRRQVADAKRALAGADEQLRRRYPRYVELARPEPVTAAQVQGLLRAGEAVLTFAVLERSVVVFAVTREQFRMAVSPVDAAALAEKIRVVRSAGETFAATGSLPALGRLDPAQLHELYRVLVAPVDDVLAGAARVLVAGDGPVHTLPLEMLVTRYGESERRAFAAARAAGPALSEYATLPYLGLRTHFSYLPSLSALPSQRLYAKPAVRYQRELVSFADPVFGAETGTAKNAIPRLPETAEEAREIASTLGGKAQLYLRDEAQESTLKSLDLKATRYLHIATHGFLAGEFLPAPGEVPAPGFNLFAFLASRPAAARPERTAQPALALTLVGDLRGEDGVLTMKEVIESLDLNAELVVLSACNTAGEHRSGNGEGFAGLTRSFMYAGARNLLVTHWSVESASTQEFVTDVFKQVKQGRSVGDAVFEARKAMLSAQADGRPRAHPYFWAPFVHVGD